MHRKFKTDAMDALLYASAQYAGRRELEEYTSADPSVVLSPSADKRLQKRLRQERKHTSENKPYSSWFTSAKRAAIIVLAVLSISFVGALSIDAVREAIWNFFVEWGENSIFFKYETEDDTKPPSEILEYKKPRLGEEFERYEIVKNSMQYVVEYENSNTLIAYHQGLLDGYEVHLSEHSTEMTEITVNGYKGVMARFTTGGVQQVDILWTDNVYSYVLTGNVTLEELLKIAESIQ